MLFSLAVIRRYIWTDKHVYLFPIVCISVGILCSFVQHMSSGPPHYNSCLTVVTPADRPKSVHNRCAIERFGGVPVLSLFKFSVSIETFVIRLSQLSSFSLFFSR